MTASPVKAGDVVDIDFRPGTTVRVTDRMFTALRVLRTRLIEAARNGQTVTYQEAAAVTDNAYHPQGLGRLLDILSVDCQRRGEPSLAALVVQKRSGEVGHAFVGDADSERSECIRYWRNRRAAGSGAEEEPDAPAPA